MLFHRECKLYKELHSERRGKTVCSPLTMNIKWTLSSSSARALTLCIRASFTTRGCNSSHQGVCQAQQRVSNICDSRGPGCSLTDFFLWCHYLRLEKGVINIVTSKTHAHTHTLRFTLICTSCLLWCQQIYEHISPLRMNLIKAADTLMPPVTDLLLSGSAVKAIFALDNSVANASTGCN